MQVAVWSVMSLSEAVPAFLDGGIKIVTSELLWFECKCLADEGSQKNSLESYWNLNI